MPRPDPDHIIQRLSAHEPRLIPPEAAPHRAGVAIIFSPGCQDVLFIRRAEQQGDPWSGHMAFPGGTVEADDPSHLQAARRETAEEVGLDLASGARLLGRISDVRASAGGRVIPMAISPFVFELLGPGSIVPNVEVQEVVWGPVGRLLDPGLTSTLPYTLKGETYELPCLRLDGRVIWGLTYQMLMILFSALGWQAGQEEAR